jgi:hypothetical protein
MLIEPNEWLLHHLCPDSEHRPVALEFLRRRLIHQDLLIIRRPSPFTVKLGTFLKQWPMDPELRQFARLHYASDVVRLVEPQEVNPVPAARLKAVDPDDVYLVECLEFSRHDPDHD